MSILFLIPFVIVAISGFFLSLRSFSSYIQPTQQKRSPGITTLPISYFVQKAIELPAAELQSADQIKGIEVKPSEGVVHLRTRKGFEIQFDGTNGDVLSAQMRYTTWLVRIHEGSIVPDWLWWVLYFPLGPVLIFLAVSGGIMFFRVGRKGSK